jgi:hypothetical protein
MNVKKTLAGVAFVIGAFASISANASSFQAISPSLLATKPHFLVLAQMTPQQAQCQQEQQQLAAQISRCGNNAACRQQLQAAIASHNARCR